MLDQIYPGVSLGHPVRQRIRCQRDSLCSNEASVIDDLEILRVAQIREEVVTSFGAYIGRSLVPPFKKANILGDGYVKSSGLPADTADGD